MSVEPGRTLLHYRIVDKVGEGGMGVVWRAVDTSLDRPVALKELPAALASQPERLTRFEREAKLLASLHHPNIAAVYGLHAADGQRFLTMELVEGEDLARRLARGPLPVDEALDVARQVALALEAAHEQGIVHRDLKPANVLCAADGTVKVVDFGLAKALEPQTDAISGDPSRSPTLTGAGTALGVILGTAAYMSPEQGRGRAVDRRADIWAFGVVLYEMLTGERLFAGETVSDTLAAVLTRDPDWSRLPAATPPAIRGLLRRCLDRDPRRRLRDIGEARVLLETPELGVPETEPAPASSARPRSLLAAVLLALVAAAIAVVATWVLKPIPDVPTRRLSIGPPAGIPAPRTLPRISPDGRSMFYTADGRLWVQTFDQLTAQLVVGAEGVTLATWAPDGSALAFAVGSRLYHAPVGGDPVLVADLPSPLADPSGGLSWTARNTLVYATGDDDLYEVPVTGGTPRSILTPDLSHETDFHEPWALPDGRGVLYVVHRRPEGLDTLEVLAEGARKVVLREQGAWFSHPAYSPTGHIFVERSDTSVGLWAVPFSLSRLEVTGPPVLVTSEGSHATVSRDGTLLYSNAVSGGNHTLVIVDPDGTVAAEVGGRLQHADNATLSPEQDRVAACVIDGKDDNLWTFDLARRSRSRIAYGADCGSSRGGVAWSGDGSRVVYGNTAASKLIERRTDGSDEETEIVDGLAPSLGLDDRHVVFVRESPENRADIWYLRLDGSSEPRPFVATQAREDEPRLSPDGALLAYVSDETGRREVYVRPFPGGGAQWQVSSGGGDSPRWSPSSDRVFFVQNETTLMSAGIRRRPKLEIGSAERRFDAAAGRLGLVHGYDVFADGRIVTVRYGASVVPGGDLTLVTGWRGP